MNSVIEVPAELYDRLEWALMRAGCGHRMNDAGAIDLTDIAVTRGEPVGLAKPKQKRRRKQIMRG